MWSVLEDVLCALEGTAGSTDSSGVCFVHLLGADGAPNRFSIGISHPLPASFLTFKK